MMLPTMTAQVASIIGTRLGLTAVLMPMVVKMSANTWLAEAAFSAIFRVIKNKITF